MRKRRKRESEAETVRTTQRAEGKRWMAKQMRE